MKLREFWISKEAQEHTRQKPINQWLDKFIHVREVNPALDSAYIECDKSLEKILFHLNNGAISANEALCLIRIDTEKALTALNKWKAK